MFFSLLRDCPHVVFLCVTLLIAAFTAVFGVAAFSSGKTDVSQVSFFGLRLWKSWSNNFLTEAQSALNKMNNFFINHYLVCSLKLIWKISRGVAEIAENRREENK